MPEELGVHRGSLPAEPAGGGQHPSAPPAEEAARCSAGLPALLVLPEARHDLANRQPPPQRPGSACPKPAPRAPSKQGGLGPAGLPPPRVRMRGAALPPSDTAGPCGVERRGVREGEQLEPGAEPPANAAPCNLGLLPHGGGRPWGSPPARRAAAGGSRGARSLSPTGVCLGSAMGKGQMLSATTPQLPGEERSSLPGTGRGGEEGREGRRTTAPQPQAGKLLASSGPGATGEPAPRRRHLRVPQHPLGCPGHLPWGRGTPGR